MKKNRIDFVLIGAQKAGTSSYFRYLYSLPDIFLPREKEVPFFSDDRLYARGDPWFIKEYYGNAAEDLIWGNVSPHYMADTSAPKRIHIHNPTTRIIALLRNPIERAHSHFAMATRRGHESRTFARAILDSLGEDVIVPRNFHTDASLETRCYVKWGEYGRILAPFFELFGPGRVLILFTDELRDQRRDALRSTKKFLGLHDGYVPQDLSVESHHGGMRQKLPWARAASRSIPFIGSLWHALPTRTRNRLSYWFDEWNVVPFRPEEREIDEETREAMRHHFWGDVKALEGFSGKRVPWPEFADI